MANLNYYLTVSLILLLVFLNLDDINSFISLRFKQLGRQLLLLRRHKYRLTIEPQKFYQGYCAYLVAWCWWCPF